MTDSKTSTARDLDDFQEEGEAPQPLIAGDGVDPLAALLDLDLSSYDDTITVQVPIKGTKGSLPWTIKVIEDIDEIRTRCTTWVRKPGARKDRVQELNYDLFNRELIVEAVVNPDLTDRMLAAKFVGARTPADVVAKLLKPGTISKVSDAIMDHSGYDDVELVKEGKG